MVENNRGFMIYVFPSIVLASPETTIHVVGCVGGTRPLASGSNAKISEFWRNLLRTFWREQRENRKANIRMAKGKSSSLAKQLAELEVKAPKGMQCT